MEYVAKTLYCMLILLFFLASPLKKGEKKNDIWMWPLYKVQLPVTCGEQEGVLDRNRMAKGHRSS